MLWKFCTQYASKFGKLSSDHRTGKGHFLFQSQRKAMKKECSNYHTIALTLHTSKVMLKILQASLQQYMNQELPDVQDGFRKGKGIQISNCQHLLDHQKNKRVSEKHLLLLYWLRLRLCVEHNKLWNILKEMGKQNSLPTSWEICMKVKKQQLEPDMKQQTVSNLGKEYIKAVYCHPAYITSMQSI